MRVKAAVEAVLFAAGKPMRAREIADVVGADVREVRKALKELIEEYSAEGRGVEVVRVGQRYVMQVKSECLEYAYRVGRRQLSDEELRVLAVIAYYQPIKQSEVRLMFNTSRVYDHIEKLKGMGLIYTRRVGRSLELRTTKKFNEYFGIDASKPEEVKKWFEEKMKGGESDA
jgi:segregation and condensation protein B